MMGVQVTASKRKLETAATAGSDSCPAKAGRWEPAGSDDCIARLQAVAVPSDAWRPTPVPTPPPPTTPTPTTTATFLSADEFDDDDEFEDELSDDDRCSIAPADAIRYQSLTYEYQHPLHHHHHQSATSAQAPSASSVQHQVRSSYTGTWQYYAPPATQQTIRCEENGKSYLELGAAPTPIAAAAATTRVRCCDGRTRWCNVPCYRQRRLAVLNLSMCKLARYRQCSDPSLRRSVLICNTLRHIEREMEAEGQQPCPPHHPPPPEPCYTPPPSSFTECSPQQQQQQQQQQAQHTTSTGTHQVLSGRPAAVVPVSPAQLDPYEHSLREFASPSGRATPFPIATTADTDSGIGDDDAGRSINWGSVLSLTSQTDLEPLNNNELYAELGLSSGDLQEWKEPQHGEWDSFMHVLVGGS